MRLSFRTKARQPLASKPWRRDSCDSITTEIGGNMASRVASLDPSGRYKGNNYDPNHQVRRTSQYDNGHHNQHRRGEQDRYSDHRDRAQDVIGYDIRAPPRDYDNRDTRNGRIGQHGRTQSPQQRHDYASDRLSASVPHGQAPRQSPQAKEHPSRAALIHTEPVIRNKRNVNETTASQDAPSLTANSASSKPSVIPPESPSSADLAGGSLDSLVKLQKFKAEVEASRILRNSMHLEPASLAKMAESFLMSRLGEAEPGEVFESPHPPPSSMSREQELKEKLRARHKSHEEDSANGSLKRERPEEQNGARNDSKRPRAEELTRQDRSPPPTSPKAMVARLAEPPSEPRVFTEEYPTRDRTDGPYGDDIKEYLHQRREEDRPYARSRSPPRQSEEHRGRREEDDSRYGLMEQPVQSLHDRISGAPPSHRRSLSPPLRLREEPRPVSPQSRAPSYVRQLSPRPYSEKALPARPRYDTRRGVIPGAHDVRSPPARDSYPVTRTHAPSEAALGRDAYHQRSPAVIYDRAPAEYAPRESRYDPRPADTYATPAHDDYYARPVVPEPHTRPLAPAETGVIETLQALKDQIARLEKLVPQAAPIREAPPPPAVHAAYVRDPYPPLTAYVRPPSPRPAREAHPRYGDHPAARYDDREPVRYADLPAPRYEDRPPARYDAPFAVSSGRSTNLHPREEVSAPRINYVTAAERERREGRVNAAQAYGRRPSLGAEQRPPWLDKSGGGSGGRGPPPKAYDNKSNGYNNSPAGYSNSTPAGYSNSITGYDDGAAAGRGGYNRGRGHGSDRGGRGGGRGGRGRGGLGQRY